MAAGSQKHLASSSHSSTQIPGQERHRYFDCDRDDSIEKPNSRGAFVQVVFLALGISSLLPWNAIITTLPFFLTRLRETPFHDTFTSWLSILSNGMGLVAMAVSTWAGEQFTGPSSFSISITALICLFSFLAVFPFFAFSSATFFMIGLGASSLSAAAGGFLQASTITLAPKYGTGAITSYMSGSALSAVGISILQVATSYTSTDMLPDLDSASWSAIICFMSSVLILVSTLALYQMLRSNTCATLDNSENLKDFDIEELPSERTHLLRRRSQSLPKTPQGHTGQPQNYAIYNYKFAIFYAGVVTLCLFPTITATIDPVNENIDPLIFNALHFLVFNVADLAGRSLASMTLFSSTNGTFLAVYSASRSLFIPFFVACNVTGSSTPVAITSDVVYMLGLFLFGLTHGHCSTVSLVAASRGEGDAENGRAARVAQFWMMVGVVVGGLASFGVREAFS